MADKSINARDLADNILETRVFKRDQILPEHSKQIEWQTYTPRLRVTNGVAPEVGADGYVRGRFNLVGTRCDVDIIIVFSGVGVIAGAGDYFAVSLPIEAYNFAFNYPGMQADMWQAGQKATASVQVDGTDYGWVRLTYAQTNPGQELAVGPTRPWNWTPGSVIYIHGSYESVTSRAVNQPAPSGNVGGGGNPTGTATKLAFAVQPPSTTPNTTMANVVVSVQDASSNIVTTATNAVTLAIGTNPSAGTLSRAGTTYQAEEATLSGAGTGSGTSQFGIFPAVGSTNTGYTGSGYVGWWDADGQGVTFNVNAPSAASYTVAFRYANGTGSTSHRRIKVNGSTHTAAKAFADTGGWSTYSAAVTISASLNAGANTIGIDFDTATGSDGFMDFDCITVATGLTVSAVNGLATFDGLSINNAGTGYTLSATASGLTTATSSAFNITTPSGSIATKEVGMNAVFNSTLADLAASHSVTSIRVEFPRWQPYAATTGGWTVNHFYGTEDPAVVLALAGDRGMKVLPILSSGAPGSIPDNSGDTNTAFAAAAVAFAQRYCAGGSAWSSAPLSGYTALAPDVLEILNEPYFSNNPASYLDLLIKVRAALDAAGLSSIGILGANTDNAAGSWGNWNEYLTANSGWSYCVGVTNHPYGPAYLPADPNNGHGWGCVERAYNQSGLPVYVTEIGWGTGGAGAGGGAPDQATKDLWTANILTELDQRDYIAGVWYYQIANEAEADYAPNWTVWDAYV